MKKTFLKKRQRIKDIIFKELGQDRRIEVMYSQYYKRLKGIEEIEKSGINYDMIFLTRPDFKIDKNINMNNLEKDYVYLSKYTDQDGYHDFFFIRSSENLKKICSLYYYIENKLCDKIQESSINKITCPHAILTTYIKYFTDIKNFENKVKNEIL